MYIVFFMRYLEQIHLCRDPRPASSNENNVTHFYDSKDDTGHFNYPKNPTKSGGFGKPVYT